jgi:hypothetical protein
MYQKKTIVFFPIRLSFGNSSLDFLATLLSELAILQAALSTLECKRKKQHTHLIA